MYLLMIVLTLAKVKIPAVDGHDRAAVRGANSFCAMLMVGMLMDLPASRRDVKDVLTVIGWRVPFSDCVRRDNLVHAAVLPSIREAVALCCLAPIAVFSTLFTDKVLGNAKLAGFSLTLTAVLSLIMMTGAHFLFTAIA